MQRVMVIGATGLIGRHIVQAFEEQESPVEILPVSRVATDLKADISDIHSLRSLFDSVGPIDGVICTAGLFNWGSWQEATDDDWAFSVANKLMGQINVIRCGAVSLNPGGHITLTTGVLAQEPLPGSGQGTVANAAIEGAVRSAAMEYDQLCINAVSPGWISETLDAMGQDPAAGVPAMQIARLYVQLQSDSRTGEVLRLLE
ncbi:short chain dehydrogenase [Parendozoicomonas haliclonae]|uniref:Short chain dehydrogenase n=1 Tax=Parendozoicomonas haliclonae TaxID=1960125 RepID=A0A1X7ATP0_9GAMM|nr:short chain dehydrogenase [Parendozoicomonas haliclonae]SMA50777.1 short chain dehydrogenase [Parendozoicomonas haliclonae]